MAHKNESEFWQSVKRRMASVSKLHLSRIENDVGSGIPDLSLCCEGKYAWVELKVFCGSRLKFRSSQFAWATSHAKAGGAVFVLARDDSGQWLLFSAASLFSLSKEPVDGSGKAFYIRPVGVEPLWRGAEPAIDASALVHVGIFNE